MLYTNKPTKRQQSILDFIKRFRAKHGYSPSIREIGKQFDIVSPNGVMCHLTALEKKGALRRTPNISRALVPVKDFA